MSNLHETITLIGAGGIGVALLPVLARFQPARVTIWDDDIVKPENLINQLFWMPENVGFSKAVVAAKWLDRAGMTEVYGFGGRYLGSRHFDTIVISAVDSMESRRLIWSGTKEERSECKLLLDGRLSRETPHFFQLFAIQMNDSYARESYEELLEGDGEPDTGRRDIDMVPAPLVLSGIIGTLLVRWSRGDDLPWRVDYDGVNMTLTSFASEKRS